MGKSSLEDLKSASIKGVEAVRAHVEPTVQAVLQGELPKRLGLERIGYEELVSITLMLWPALWGLLLTDASFGAFAGVLILALVLRLCGTLYFDLNPAESENLKKTSAKPAPNTRKNLLVQGGIPALLGLGLAATVLAYKTAAASLFFVILWGITLGAYPWLVRWVWWPQVYAGGVFGALAVLIGHGAGMSPSLVVFFLFISGWLWVMGIETLQAGLSYREDMQHRMKSLALWLGKQNALSFAAGCLVLAIVFLFLTGALADKGSLFYGSLMLAQGILVWMYQSVRRIGITKSRKEVYAALFWAAFAITLGFLLG